jgi:hypothetical protein
MIPGYHINTRQPVEGLDAYRVYPKKHFRVYAGQDPVCYRFADESEFRQYFPEPETDQEDENI